MGVKNYLFSYFDCINIRPKPKEFRGRLYIFKNFTALHCSVALFWALPWVEEQWLDGYISHFESLSYHPDSLLPIQFCPCSPKPCAFTGSFKIIWATVTPPQRVKKCQYGKRTAKMMFVFHLHIWTKFIALHRSVALFWALIRVEELWLVGCLSRFEALSQPGYPLASVYLLCSSGLALLNTLLSPDLLRSSEPQ